MRLKIFFEGGLNGEEVVNFWMGAGAVQGF